MQLSPQTKPTHHSSNVYSELVAAFVARPNHGGADRVQLYFTEHPEAPLVHNPAALQSVRELRGGSETLLFRGYFQSPMYFSACQDVLENKLRGWLERTARDAVDAWFRAHAVNPQSAFFVHVRLGDFVGNDAQLHGENADRFLSVSLADWIGQGVCVQSAVAIVLSNDPDAVDIHHPCVASALAAAGVRVERVGVGELDEVASMLLMSDCRLGGIVPGSTFSWWPAWLLLRAEPRATGRIYTPDPWSPGMNDRRRCDLCTMLI